MIIKDRIYFKFQEISKTRIQITRRTSITFNYFEGKTLKTSREMNGEGSGTYYYY